MWTLRRARRRPALSYLATAAALALLVPAMTVSAAATVARPRPVPAPGNGGGVKPGRLGELDCNGFSPIQQSVKPGLACAEPHGPYGGRFLDHGHYIGHDEPSVRFLSTRPGSGNNFSITENLPRDPAALPTVQTPGKDVTHWFELTSAPWFSIDLCDPNSAPLLPCTPRSDANARPLLRRCHSVRQGRAGYDRRVRRPGPPQPVLLTRLRRETRARDAPQLRTLPQRSPSRRRRPHLQLRMHLLPQLRRRDEQQLPQLRRRTSPAATPTLTDPAWS